MSVEMVWSDNPAVLPFRQIISAISAGLEEPLHHGNDDPFKELIADTLVFIQSVIAHKLQTSDEPLGLDLLA